MEREIQSILENNEQVIWEGKRDLKSSIISGFFGLILFLIIGLIFFFVFSSGSGTCTINGEVRPPEDCASVGKYIMYGLFALALLSPLMTYLSYKVTRYVITNKRVLIKTGLIGADMRSIYYDQIRSAFVNVGLVGKLYGTGSILIDTGKFTQTKNGTRTDYDRFSNIKKPYEIYKILQERLSNRKEGLHSGRADYESNKSQYKDFIQETEQMRKQV